MNPSSTPDRGARIARRIGKFLHFLLPLLMLAGGVLGARHLLRTAPKSERMPPPKTARVVEVREVRAETHRVQVDGMGTVTPAQQVDLAPRVSGPVAALSPELVPGGRFQRGEVLLTLDRADYEIALRQREAALAQAKSRLETEQGQQQIARREFELMGREVSAEDRALMLRKPQLDAALADVAAAEAALEQARLNLERTSVTAPFNAVVRERTAQVGMVAVTAVPVARLMGTDEFWIETLLPAAQLRWIEIPGARAVITHPLAWPADAAREGRVVRLLGDLEPAGRMARVLVSVPDPEALQPANAAQPRLLAGDFVQVRIEGREQPDVVRLDRALVREGDTAWILTPGNTLDIRKLDILHASRDAVLVRGGLADGDRVVTSGLSFAVPGMPLRQAGADDAAAAEKPR